MNTADIRAALSNLDTLPPLDQLRELRRLQRALRWLEASYVAGTMNGLRRLAPKHRPTNRVIDYCRRTTRRMVMTTRVGVTTPEHHLSRRRKALRT